METETLTTATDTDRRTAAHRMGTNVFGLNREDALAAAGADFALIPGNPVAEIMVDNQPVKIDLPAVSVHRSDTGEVLGVHAEKYQIVQHTEALDFAFDVAGTVHGTVNHIGVPQNGALFFAEIVFDDLVIDPEGIADRIQRQAIVWNSANGKLPVMVVDSNLRIICLNQLPGLRSSAREEGIVVKHTASAPARIEQARLVAPMLERGSAKLMGEAMALLATKGGHDIVSMVEREFWPLENGAEGRALTIAEKRRETVHALFGSQTNEGAVGRNLWAVDNAFSEYLDHGRGTSDEKRAEASLLPTGHVTERKRKIREFLLSLTKRG